MKELHSESPNSHADGSRAGITSARVPSPESQFEDLENVPGPGDRDRARRATCSSSHTRELPVIGETTDKHMHQDGQ